MSRANTAVSFVASLLLVAWLAGCEDNPYTPPRDNGLPRGAFIDDPILLEASDAVDGFLLDEEIIFNLRDVPMVKNGTVNDLEISYSAGSNCDRDTWIYNYDSESWEQIGFRNAPEVGCFGSPHDKNHLLSAAGIRARDVLGRDDRVKLRWHSPPSQAIPQQESLGDTGNPTARALRINPDHFSVSLVGPEPRHCYGLTFDGEALWVSERRRLLGLSTGGEVVGQHCAPAGWPVGLAFNGRILLLADAHNDLSLVTLDGYHVGGWPLPTEYAGGLTYSPHRVWFGEKHGSESRIFGMVDTVRVGPGGTAYSEVPDTLDAPGGSCHGLACDGDHLLVASDSLYVLAFDGEIVASYGLPVKEAEDIAWDGEAVWVINRGPKELASRDQVITRVRLR